VVSRDRGRPPTSSVSALEDAATELFLEQGYHATTIDEIAARAGISRATFFHYVANKSDLLWVALDEALNRLSDRLSQGDGLTHALMEVASAHPPDRIPLLASQREPMGLGEDGDVGGGWRVLMLHRLISRVVPDPWESWILTGAVVGCVLEWVSRPAPRDSLAESLGAVLDTIRRQITSGVF
jgi:AcrR family transcriptional regulator